jgi:integrase
MEEILARRRHARLPGCPLIFHHERRPIVDYRKAWRSACVINGFGQFYCRDCRDDGGNYVSVLDAEHRCPRCGRKWKRDCAKYIGKYMHDFRRSAAYEMRKAGVPDEEAMKVTGHLTNSMHNRYADLFSDEEIRAAQQEAQKKRREWRKAEAERLPEQPSTGAVDPPTGRVH